MIYHLIDTSDIKKLINKKLVSEGTDNYKYDEFFLCKIFPSSEVTSISKRLINKHGGKKINSNRGPSRASCCVGSIDNYAIFLYDTKEFWKEFIEEKDFMEIEL